MANRIDVVLDEAFVNYDNQRYQDAAASFRYLINSSVNSKNYNDALYFSYRLLNSLEKVDDTLKERTTTWKNLGLFCLKVALQNAEELIATSWTVESLEVKELILRHLGMADEHLEVIRSLTDKYLETIQEGGDQEAIVKKIKRNPFLRDYMMRNKPDEFKEIFEVGDEV